MAEELTSTVAPIAETPTPPENAAPKQPDQNQKRWAHMAKQEKAFRAAQAQFKAERDAFAQQKAEMEKHSAWRDRLAKKDFDALSEYGITKDDLTSYLVNQPNPQDRIIRELTAQIEALKGGQDEIKNAMTEQEKRQYDQAIQAYKSEAEMAAKSDPEKFELVNANFEDGIAAATALVEEVWKSQGRLMTVEEALNDVEEYYLEAILASATKSKKIQAKLMPKPPEVTKIPQPSMGKTTFSTAVRDAVSAKVAPKTLTHQLIPAPTSKPATGKDRVARAIAAFKGQQV